MIHVIKQHNKFIAAISADKIFLGNDLIQKLCKIADIGISFFVSQTVIDDTEIIQVKHTQCHFFRHWLRCAQKFFTFIFIWDSGRFIQIHFFLQFPVQGGIAKRPHQVQCSQKNQCQNINRYHFFQNIKL